MNVVSGTAPLISLFKANCLELLELLFSEALIPDAVYSELTGNLHFREEADQINGCSFI